MLQVYKSSLDRRIYIVIIYFQWVLFIAISHGTIDLNISELEYIADHLKKAECRTLVAALHDPNFDIVNNIDAAERKVPDVSCLKLLLHWNSQVNEGKGETHVMLTHRLRQLGREDLADWVSRTVFHQLGQDLNRSLLSDPFKKLAETNETEERFSELSTTTIEEEEGDEWTPVDTILYIMLIFCISIIVMLLAKMGCIYCKKKRRVQRAPVLKIKKLHRREPIYERIVESDMSSGSSSSVTEFDVTAISLMGVKKPTAQK